MRLPSVALAALALLGGTAAGLDVVELKNGRLYQAESVAVRGDKLLIQLHTGDRRERVRFAVPISKVIPEFVYYAWMAQTKPDDAAELGRVAAWARTQGLYRHAWRSYEMAAKVDGKLRAKLPDLARELHEEEATWLFDEAWRRFRADEVTVARKHAERILEAFADTGEVGRATELLKIIAEREQFLSEQKKQEEIAARARKQRREMERHLARVEKADRLVLRTRLSDEWNARRNLTWAAYAYRTASISFQQLLPYVEVDDLRLTLEALIRDLEPRMVRTFTKLADLHYLRGDGAAALDAVHEVLALDPDNKAAGGLRDRILDRGTEPPRYEPDYGYPYRIRYGFPYVRHHRGFRYHSIGLGIARIRHVYRYPYGYVYR